MPDYLPQREKIQPQTLNMPLTGVDTHAHLDMEDYNTDLAEVFGRARDSGVSHIGQIFLSPEAYHLNRARFAPHANVFMLLGIHPHDADNFSSRIMDQMTQALTQDARLKAVGEIGLDFHGDLSSHEGQIKAFKEQLKMAATLDKPVVIHSRAAHDETMDILLQAGFENRPLLWHCFGGNPEEALGILARGWHISIPGTVTFPKNDLLREAVRAIPLDRLVLETDCPYLTPMPWRGRRNEPAYLPFTAQAVAAAKNMDPAELWTSCGQTARAFFHVD